MERKGYCIWTEIGKEFYCFAVSWNLLVFTFCLPKGFKYRCHYSYCSSLISVFISSSLPGECYLILIQSKTACHCTVCFICATLNIVIFLWRLNKSNMIWPKTHISIDVWYLITAWKALWDYWLKKKSLQPSQESKQCS